MREKESTHGCLAIKPGNISHEEAVAVTYGGILSMHFIKKMNIKSGQKVLIYGASGAIGTIAIQLAKYFGAEVTAVCSASNTELVKSLGADKTIDYMKDDSIKKLELYDFVLDAVGRNKSSKLKIQCKKALKRNGKYISVDDGVVKLSSQYLVQLKEIIEAGHLKAVIDSRYPLEQIVQAHRYVDKGHKKGSVVITI